MTSIFGDANEALVHSDAIADLVSEIRRPESEVRSAYEAVYTALNADAHVRDFLPLLVARRTRDLLRGTPPPQ